MRDVVVQEIRIHLDENSNIVTKNLIGFATTNEAFSGLFADIVFGVISPNIKTSTVINPVAMATPCAPNIAVNNEVVIDVAAILTILFPINIDVNNLLESSIRVLTNLAPFTPSSSICLIFILLSDIKAVSEAEKNPDPINKIINKTI